MREKICVLIDFDFKLSGEITRTFPLRNFISRLIPGGL